jgi:hypothetical protein
MTNVDRQSFGQNPILPAVIMYRFAYHNPKAHEKKPSFLVCIGCSVNKKKRGVDMEF